MISHVFGQHSLDIMGIGAELFASRHKSAAEYTFGFLHYEPKLACMNSHFDLNDIPDVRDGLTRKERVILYCLKKAQDELGGRNVPTIMLYGRVVELVDISEHEFQAILSKLVGLTRDY